MSMGDYQLLGDGFGYHPGYAPTGNPSNNNPGGPNMEQPPGPNNAAMAAMMSSSAIGGSPGYGMIPPHGARGHGLPQRSLPPFGAPLPMPPGSVPLGGLGDAMKVHDQYASSGFPGASSQSAMRSGHYPQHDSRYGHASSSGYPGVPMGSGGPSSLGPMSQHNGGIGVPQSSLTSLPGSSSYQTRGLMSGYNDQRMLSPILGPGSGSPYPGPYPSSYGPIPTGGPGTRLWHNQGMSHLQQRPPYGYNTSGVGPPPPSSLGPPGQTSSSRSGQGPPPSPFGPGASDYGSLHSQQPTKQPHQPPTQQQQQQQSSQQQQQQQQQQQSQSQAQPTRPYYSTSSGRVGAQSSSLTSFIPSEPPSPMSPYLTSSYSSQNISASQGNSTSSSSSSGNSGGPRQPQSQAGPPSHYTSLGYPGPGSGPTGSGGGGGPPSGGMIGSSGSSSSSVPPGSVNYPGQQYQGYSVSQGYSDSSSRLSPYTMSSGSSGGPNTGPNSPGYRAPFSAASLTSMSPRRPTPTPPAGSPMPPTSRTPDRGSTTISTSGPTSSYPSSGSLTSPSGPGLSPGNSSKSSGLAGPPGSSSSHNASSSSSSSQVPQSQSSASSSTSHGPLSSHQSTPINSLQQLEQMVMPHLNSSSSSSSSSSAAANSSNKINSISSIISSTPSSSSNNSASNPYYMSGSSSNNIHGSQKADQQQPSNLYPRFPSPSSASSGPGGYYGGNSGYPQSNSSSWRPPPTPSQSSTGPGSNSMSNTQSPMGSSVPYSPASQIDQQQQPSSQSKEVPSPGLSRSLTSTTSSNNSSSMTGQQYSMFDNQAYSSNSSSIDNSNYQSQSNPKQDLVNKNVMSPRTPGSNQQSQPMSPFNFRNIDANKTSSYGSPQITKDDSGSESKSDNGKAQSDGSNSNNIYSVLTSPANAGGDNRSDKTTTSSSELTSRSSRDDLSAPGPGQSTVQSMDPGQYHSNYMSGGPSESSYNMSQQQSQHQPQHPHSQQQQQQQQQQSDGSNMYSNQPGGNQPQGNWDYGSGYNQSYDMNMTSDSSMNQPYMGPDSMMYNQNYNQGPGMGSMMSNQMNQNEYGGNSDMNQSQPYDPYGDTFDQEPPIAKKKGKGRPRKDPAEPKKEKKPRAPRAPKGAGSRGRGRGARSSPESRMGASPSMMSGPMTPNYDGSYSMGSNPGDMYSYPTQGPGGQMPIDPSMGGGGGPMSYPPPPPPSSLPPHPSHGLGPQGSDMYGQMDSLGQLPPPDFQSRPDIPSEMMYPPPPSHDPSRIPGNDPSAYKPMPPESSIPYDSQLNQQPPVHPSHPPPPPPPPPQSSLPSQSISEHTDSMQQQSHLLPPPPPQQQQQQQQQQHQPREQQQQQKQEDASLESSEEQTDQLGGLSSEIQPENSFTKNVHDENINQSSSSETIASTTSNDGQTGETNDNLNIFRDPSLTSDNFYGITGDDNSLTQPGNINQTEVQPEAQALDGHGIEHSQVESSFQPLPPLPPPPLQGATPQLLSQAQQSTQSEDFLSNEVVSSLGQNFPNQTSTPPPPVEVPQLLPPPPELPTTLSDNTCDDSVVISKMEFNEEQTPASTPVKRKAKKRKAKELKDTVPFDEGPFMSEGGHQTFFSEDGQENKKKKRKRKKKDENVVKSEDTAVEGGEMGEVGEGGGEGEPEKTKKKKKKRVKKKVVEEEIPLEYPAEDATLPSDMIGEGGEGLPEDATIDGDTTLNTTDGSASKSKGKKKRPSRAKPKLKDGSGKSKKKLPKLALKFGKSKKRKRLGSSDASDIEKTPPPSPIEDPLADSLKRRSARNTKRQKYTDDIDLDLSEEDSNSAEKGEGASGEKKALDSNVQVTKIAEDTMVVDKIMASRMGEREIEAEDGEEQIAEGQKIKIEEYYVKYKNLSYLHCEWRTEEELEMGDKRVNQKIKRWKQKKESEIDINFLDDEPFNPDYTEVDRILDVQEIEETIEEEVEIGEDDEDSRDDTKVEIVPVLMSEKSEGGQLKEGEDANKVHKSETTIDTEVTIAPVEVMPEADEISSKIDGDNKSDEDQKTEVNSETDESEKQSSEPETKVDATSVEEKDEDVEMKDSKDQDGESSIKEKDESEILENLEETSKDNKDIKDIKDIKDVKDVKDDENEKNKMDSADEETDEKKDATDEADKESKLESDENKSNEAEKDGEKTVASEVESKPVIVKRTKKVLKKRIVRHYLVKWRALPYEESTWELEDDLDPLKIAHFWKFKSPPPKDKWKPKKRPKANEWKKLDSSPVYKSGNTLREYQLEGVNWLMFCWHNGRNCILADEMGLGKTIQSISFVSEMFRFGITGPFLIIVPLSTIGNWQREFETWTDLNVITYHGSSASRNMLQEYEMYYKKENGERYEGFFKFQVMITTFEVVLTDCLELREIHWRACIIDEAHRLKNRNCKLLEGLRLLNMEHRVLLTGTPLQNNVEELFSLLNFLEPSQFASSELFIAEFGDLKTEDQVDKLKALLKPMMLRRLKEDVEKSLAPKEETIIEVELTNVQKKYYRAILERNFQFLTKGNSKQNIPNLMNTMMELRKCCIHPYLINGAEESIISEYRQSKPDSSSLLLDALVHASGKLVLIDKLLPRLKADGHRVLIFSQMVRCLDILEDYLVQNKYPFERIDGRVRGNMRQAAIDRFSKPGSDRFVFLLCTRAGGLGINLTAADTVIIFDSDWNPQNDLQAQARCHRIGQSKMVKVYRLICRNTYEREMFDKASLKLGLDRAVLQSMNSNATVSENGLSKSDVEDLLRKGAYGAIMDDDNAGDKFCEEDIDQILQRRTQIITLESEEKGSTFSKATFAASENRSDIEIDDPNFWEKWAKKAQLDVEEISGKNDLIVQEPRRRTQTKRFGQDEQMLEISDADSSDEDEENVSNRTRGGRTKFKLKKGKRGRERDDEFMEDFAPGNWTKAECYQVEKGLLCYGWGRWDKYLETGIFKRHITLQDVEHVARVVMLQCLQNVRGDDKRKETSFYWEIIAPTDYKMEEGKGNKSTMPEDENQEPSPSGSKRRSKKSKNQQQQSPPAIQQIVQPIDSSDPFSVYEWAKEDFFNPDLLLPEDYRSHISKICNKILLRFKLLWYLKTEIFGDLCDPISKGISCREAPFSPPSRDGYPGLPGWWDEDADKSLLMGVFKHGYDRYNRMRLDPALCFLSRCGPPDGTALMAELTSDDINKEEEDETEAPEGVANESGVSEELKAKESSISGELVNPFPSSSDLNKRFRNLISAYQRNVKKQERLERSAAVLQEKRREVAQRRWSKKDDSDFYRTIISYGVDYNKETGQYDWSRFRLMSKLDKKSDESLTEYYKSFFAMCKKVTGRPLTDEEENYNYLVDPISEDKASRALARIELLCKIREEILPHPELDERLNLCQMSIDLPDWWICGRHDKDLLVGAAKYGLSRLDINLMNDPELSFMKIFRNDEAEAKTKVESRRDTTIEINKIEAKPKVKEAKVEKQEEQLKVEEIEKETEVKLTIEKPVDEASDEKVTPAEVKEEEEGKEEVDNKERETTNDLVSESLDSETKEKDSTEAESMEVDKIEEPNDKTSTKEIDDEKEEKVNEQEEETTKMSLDADESPKDPEKEETEISAAENEEKDPKETPSTEGKDETSVEEKAEQESETVDKTTDEEKLSENKEEEKVSAEIEEEKEKKTMDETVPPEEEKSVEETEDESSKTIDKMSEESTADKESSEDEAKEDGVPMETEKSVDEIKETDATVEQEKDKEKSPNEVENMDQIEEKEQEQEEEEEEGKIGKENKDDNEENGKQSAVESEEEKQEQQDCKKEEEKEIRESKIEEDDEKSIERSNEINKVVEELKEKIAEESPSKEEGKRKSERVVARNTQMEITIIKKEVSQMDSKASIAMVNSGSILENDGSFFNQSTDNFASRGFIRWPKERVLIVRLEQICHCVDKNDWPFAKQALFTALATVPSTPSIATADSSPRAASPVSISSMSREATPQQTPDNTPRHESVSPSPDPFMFDVANASGMIDAGGRLRSRGRRRRGRYEMEHPERAKLRNLLQQSDNNIQSSKKNMTPSMSSMINTPPLLPPLFSMSLQNFRNELANEDKGSSLLMNRSHGSDGRTKSHSHSHSHSHHHLPTVVHPFASSSSIKTPLAPPISDLPNKSSSSKSLGAPPAAHSVSNTKRIPNLDTVDLRFTKPVAGMQHLNTGSKPLAAPDKVVKRSSTPVSLSSVLDLSGPVKKDSRDEDPSLTSPTFGKKGQTGKRTGRRIDDLANNLLQRKKMMQEKQDDPVPESKPTTPSPRDMRARSELDKVETRSSTPKDRTRTPPAAHSSSRSSSALSASLTRDLSMKPPEKTNFPPPKVNPPRSGHRESSSSSRQHHHQQSVSADIAGNLGKGMSSKMDKAFNNDAVQQLKKILAENPELMNNPTFASAAAILSGASPLASNTQLLELPDSKKRSSRRSKPDNAPQQSLPKVQPIQQPPPASSSSSHSSSLPNLQNLTGDEHIPLINKLNGKKLTGSKAPTLKKLPDFLKKNPMYEMDPKWAALLRENLPALKAMSSQQAPRDPPPPTIRTRTSDRKAGESSRSKHSDSGVSPRRATAASLLANQAASSSASASSTNMPSTSSSFGFPPSSLAPFNINPNLLNSYAFQKLLMDPSSYMSAAASNPSPSSSSSRNNNSVSTSSTATSSTSSAANASQMLFPYPGLSNMGLTSSLLGLSGLNFPGLGSGFNPMSIGDFGGNEGKKTDRGSSSQEKGKSGGGSEKSISSHKSSKSSSSKNQNQNQSQSQNPNANLGLNPSLNLNDLATYSRSFPYLFPYYNSLGLGNIPLSSPHFASLAAQSGLMNGLGNMPGLGTTASTSTTTTSASTSSSHASKSGTSSASGHSRSKNSSNSSANVKPPSSSSSKHSKASASPSLSMKSPPPPTLPAASTSSSSISTPNVPTGGPSMAPSMSGVSGLGDSDDESLKSLMGQEDDEDELNGELEDMHENLDTDTDMDSGADHEGANRRGKQRRSTSSASSMKSPPPVNKGKK